MFEVWDIMDLHLPLSEVADHARRAEALGFDVVAVPDLVHDGLMSAAIAVQATERIQIATGALIAFARSPMVIAVAAWDLQASSGGRFRLGLGPQVRGNIVSRFSSEWSAPAPRMREYASAIRAIFACWQDGVPLQFEGEHYRFTRMQPFTSPKPIEHPDIPIHLAGIGPNMTALAGELADALFTHPTSAAPRFLREVARPGIARGAARAGRSTGDTRVIANPLCATGLTGAEVSLQREVHREMIALLFSTPSYWPSLDLFGWRERGERMHGLVREGRWGNLAALVDDEMLDTYVPAAPYAELAARLTERYGGAAEAVTLALPDDPSLDEEVGRVVAALKGAG